MHLEKILKHDIQELAMSFVESRTEKTYNALYFKLKPLIKNYVYSYSLFDDDLKEEIITLIMMKVWLFVDKYDPMYKFTTWIFKIAKFECLEHVRRIKKHVSIESSAEENITITPLEMSDLIELEQNYELETDEPFIHLDSRPVYDEIVSMMNDLPEIHKELLKDCLFGKLTYEELEEKHGVISNTIRSRLHNAKKSIRQKWTIAKRKQYNDKQIFIDNVNFVRYDDTKLC